MRRFVFALLLLSAWSLATPAQDVRLQVNARYPASEPLQTIPPNLLANLPQLPEDMEYRVVGKDLVLRDVDANIIVDFIPNAIRS